MAVLKLDGTKLVLNGIVLGPIPNLNLPVGENEDTVGLMLA